MPFSGPDGDCVRRARYLKTYHGGVHDRPLAASDPATKAFLAEWQEVAAHLARFVRPDQLELTLVCDLDPADPEAIDAANLLVDSLRRLPRLNVCRVRLSRAPYPQLRQIAQDAVLRGRGILPPDSPSGARGPAVPPASGLPLLTALPEELRLHILEYTDLVTPRREVLWAAPRSSPAPPRRYMAMRRPCEGRHCPDHTGCPFHACVRASGRWPAPGCFCAARHAAAAAASSSSSSWGRCQCWMPPTPLFLVCRALRDDAERVFWSGNRFVVIDGAVDEMWGPPVPGAYPEGRLAASHFFRGAVPARCLGHLRWVELVFRPRKAGGWPRRGDAVLADWCETVDWARDKIKAPALTVGMLAAYSHRDENSLGPATLTPAEAEELMVGYGGILEPLARLGGDGGLAGFYARLTWPLWRTEATRQAMGWENPDLRAETSERARREELRLSEQAERLVLGDRYGTVAGGREGPWPGPVVEYDSEWWWLHERKRRSTYGAGWVTAV